MPANTKESIHFNKNQIQQLCELYPNCLLLCIHACAHQLGHLLSRQILSAALAIIIKHKEIATFSSSILHHFIQHYKNIQDKNILCKWKNMQVWNMQVLHMHVKTAHLNTLLKISYIDVEE